MAIAMIVIAAGVMLSRASRLIGLPDIGDPFDVAEFHRLNICPDDKEVNLLIRRAAGMVEQMPVIPPIRRRAASARWPQVDPKLREWLDKNREAAALYRTGVERFDGTSNPVVQWGDSENDAIFGPFVLLAMLETARLEDQGDMEGAWGWFDTVLRTRVLVERRGSMFQRFAIAQQCDHLQSRIEAWAGDRRTGIPLLRRALNDVLAREPQPEWQVYSLKLEYLLMTGELDRSDYAFLHPVGEELDYRILGETIPTDFARPLHEARRFVLNDPEVSRRVLRLAFANWLAHVQDPDPRHKSPSVLASFQLGRDMAVPFFATGSVAPASARRMPPDELARRLLTARDAKRLLVRWTWWPLAIAEKRAYASLVVTLAEALYRRDHGKPPTSDRALVGPYLDHLPDDGSDELPAGSTETVRQASGLELDPNGR
jgi:hypothetical protein